MSHGRKLILAARSSKLALELTQPELAEMTQNFAHIEKKMTKSLQKKASVAQLAQSSTVSL